MKQPLRILHVVTRLNVGGVSKTVIETVGEQVAQGHICLIVTGNLEPGEVDMSYIAISKNIPTLLLPTLSRKISFNDLYAIYDLFLIFKIFQPHIIHTHAAKAGTVGRLAAMLFKFFG